MDYDRFKDNKKEFTKKSSEVNRSANYAMLAFSTVVLIKILTENSQSSKILLWSTLLSAGSLFIDFFQYAYYSAIYAIIFRKVDAAKQGLKMQPPPKHDQIEMPEVAMLIGDIFFWGKLMLTSASFCVLLFAIYRVIQNPALIDKLVK